MPEDHDDFSHDESGVIKPQEPCEHILRLHRYMKRNKLRVSSCGCCQGPWVDCAQCGIDLHRVHMGYWGDLG